MKSTTFSFKRMSATAIMCLMSSLISTSVHARCEPSDPFGNNKYNICPEGFAFSFTQNFKQSNYVRGKHFSGQPTQPGVPGVLQGTTNGFYTGVSVSGGTTKVTTSDGKTVINGVTQSNPSKSH